MTTVRLYMSASGRSFAGRNTTRPTHAANREIILPTLSFLIALGMYLSLALF